VRESYVRRPVAQAAPGAKAHQEGNVIDDPSLGRLTPVESGPSILDLLGCRFDQEPFLNQFLPQRVYPLAERPTCGGIAALPENERRRQQGHTAVNHILIGCVRPLRSTGPRRPTRRAGQPCPERQAAMTTKRPYSLSP
jgi:hypothetical protein